MSWLWQMTPSSFYNCININMSRVKKSNVTCEKNYRNTYNYTNNADGDRKHFSINCRVTIRPVLREIAALYLNMNINDISLCWVLRALTFWFLLILVWFDYITAVVHLLASELSATWLGLYICRTTSNDFTKVKTPRVICPPGTCQQNCSLSQT